MPLPRLLPNVPQTLLDAQQDGDAGAPSILLPSDLNIQAREVIRNYGNTPTPLPRIPSVRLGFNNWPLPGRGQLHPIDFITIMGVDLPLAEMPSGGLSLDIDKRKEPGSDYSRYVSQGKDSETIKIKILLFRDEWTGKDWWDNWGLIKDRLIAEKFDKRNAVSVAHPFLQLDGIDSILFTKRPLYEHDKGLMFTVALEGRDIRYTRGLGSGKKTGGKSKTVTQDPSLSTRSGSAAPASSGNIKTPAGKAANKPGGVKRT